MKEESRFQYKSLVTVPEEFRRVDWTFVKYYDKSFSEAEEGFRELKHELRESFADNPWVYLHFLRAVADRLLSLTCVSGQPVEKCLEYLRRRLDLEYGRYEIGLKASHAVFVAKYLAELGETDLARDLLTAERADLEAIARVCQIQLEDINKRICDLPEGSGPTERTLGT